MDVSYLQEYLAKYKNNFNRKAAISGFRATSSRPNKVERSAPKPEAIQAVLSRKEELKQKENEEARLKKENLLALRAQARKCNKQVKAIINKGASKFVVDDAKNITTVKGEEQYDMNDFGYESTNNQHIFSKLVNQYANNANCSAAGMKSGVTNTVKTQLEDKSTSGKLKRKYSRERENKGYDKNPKKLKVTPRPDAPPPVSFKELLVIARKKQSLPLANLKDGKKEKDKGISQKYFGRPLTAIEKLKLEDERRRKLKWLGKLPQDKTGVEKPQKKEQKADVKDSPKLSKKGEIIKKQENTAKLNQALEEPKQESKVADRMKLFATAGHWPRDHPQIKGIKPVQNSRPAPSEPQTSIGKDMKPQKPRYMQTKDMKLLRPQKIPHPKLRIASDSEEEEDSDMDDFIDDGDQGIDFSREIRNLFGYDKRKYRGQEISAAYLRIIVWRCDLYNVFFWDEVDDCGDMEASFSQVQKEERISAKIGLKEDLEDIRREEEERKRKIVRKKHLKPSKKC
ncbi:protein SPT2 homolog [Procambarus clarkii]|uniref:protein SPT2 homolog n=1 Tax=Procambarus clarkii TaxID=6728 RepID=UPI0037443C52